MSHYFADVNHPFHTGQTEAESLIHTYTEWGAAEIYKNDLRERMTVEEPITINEIEDFVCDAANKSHEIYEFMIENYDMRAGMNATWGRGYNEPLKMEIVKKIANAIQGTASLYLKAIEDSGVEDPGEVELLMKKITTRISSPVARVKRYNDRRKKKKTTRRMRKEYIKTGKVVKNLLPDDKNYLKALKNGEIKPVPLKSMKTPVEKEEPKEEPKAAKPKEKKKKEWKPAITLESDIDDAAEIGKKNIKRFNQIGIFNVADFIDETPEEIFNLLKEKLNYTRLDIEDLTRMQLETKIMLEVARLRTHDAVILYAAGIKTKQDLASEEQDTLWEKVQDAIQDSRVKKLLRRESLYPDLEEVGEWIESSKKE